MFCFCRWQVFDLLQGEAISPDDFPKLEEIVKCAVKVIITFIASNFAIASVLGCVVISAALIPLYCGVLSATSTIILML